MTNLLLSPLSEAECDSVGNSIDEIKAGIKDDPDFSSYFGSSTEEKMTLPEEKWKGPTDLTMPFSLACGLAKACAMHRYYAYYAVEKKDDARKAMELQNANQEASSLQREIDRAAKAINVQHLEVQPLARELVIRMQAMQKLAIADKPLETHQALSDARREFAISQQKQ